MEFHSPSIISEIINQIIDDALGNRNEAINSTELVLKSSEKVNKSEADECEEDVQIIPSTEMIILAENKSDGGIRNEDIKAEKTEFKPEELLVQEMRCSGNVDDAIMLTTKKISSPGKKSDGQDEDITTENIEIKTDDFVQEMDKDKKTTIEMTEFTSSSESEEMTDDEVENEIPSEIDQFHVENDNGESISGDGDCKWLKVDEQEMDDGKGQILQEIAKVIDLASGETNTAANNCLSDSGGAKAITKDVQINATANSNYQGDFYNNELLREKGYTLTTFERNRVLTNLSLFSSTVNLNNCEVDCFNLPNKMMEHHLIPLFEKVGKVFKLKMVLESENRNLHHAYVTYTTEEDAEKAIETLHNKKVQERFIKVVKYSPGVRLFVSGIPSSATLRELFDKFSHVTKGLKNLFFIESIVQAGKNRGFCFLQFVNHEKAKQAKNFILHNKIFGRQLFCEWITHKRVEKFEEASESSSSLQISDLSLNIRSSDLRKLFSVYGEITEIDKDGTFATVVFCNSQDAQRAADEINKKMLGKNVKISQKLTFSTKNQNKTGL